jgi:hypothetical protein
VAVVAVEDYWLVRLVQFQLEHRLLLALVAVEQVVLLKLFQAVLLVVAHLVIFPVQRFQQ